MAYDNDWSIIIPAGSDLLSTADDHFRRLRLDIGQRMDDIVDDWTADPVVLSDIDVGTTIGTPIVAVVYTGAAFSLPSQAAKTIIDFVGETLDTDDFHDNSSNPSRLTITTAAYYRITANIMVNTNTNAITAHVYILKNGGIVAEATTLSEISTIQTYAVTIIDLAAATDYYEVAFQQQSTDDWTTSNIDSRAYFMIEKLIGTT